MAPRTEKYRDFKKVIDPNEAKREREELKKSKREKAREERQEKIRKGIKEIKIHTRQLSPKKTLMK